MENLDFVILAYGNTADHMLLTKLFRKRSTHDFPSYVRRSIEVTLAILAARTADCLVEFHCSPDTHNKLTLAHISKHNYVRVGRVVSGGMQFPHSALT